ncbi:MAG: nodulation protein NfeD [Gammaproteobacteria bacterium]|jgi:membrane-bound serine protease (ClpP class)
MPIRLPALLLGLAMLAPAGASPMPDAGHVVVLTVDGPIGPATSDYLSEGFDKARAGGARAIIIRMDTPGGLDTAMRSIIQGILASPVPVVTWVSPSGARAASAGTYILYASHIAAMAPATNLGAATPIRIGGLPGGGDRPSPGSPETGKNGPKDQQPKSSPDAEERKMINDAVAYIRSLAERRGRNADWAEKAVRQAASLTANEAVEQNVVDLIADNTTQLLQAIDGRQVETARGTVTLHTRSAAITEVKPDWRNQLLAAITNPTVAYLLLLIGIYGLLFEGYNPGAILPGVAGGICLLLALFAFQVLPVNYAGLALIALGIVLMSAEAFVPSFGALGIGGIISFVVGSVMLMDTQVPGYGIPLPVLIIVSLVAALLVLGLIYLALRSRQRPVVSGREEMIGATAVALSDFEDQGMVRVHGENWSARSTTPVHSGQRLRVTEIDGLILTVAPDNTTSKE